MKKLFSIIAMMAILCSFSAFTVGCGEPAKKKDEKKVEDKKTDDKKAEEKKGT